MTLLKKVTALAASIAMVGSPLAASAAPAAQKLSISRAGAPAKTATKSKFGGDSTILLILAVILIGAGIFVLADNKDDRPTSP